MVKAQKKFVIVACEYFTKWVETEVVATLWAIWTTVHSGTRDTPFNLIFGVKTIILAKIRINTL